MTQDDAEATVPAVVKVGKGRLGEVVTHPTLLLENPGWVRRQIDWTRPYFGDRDRMRVALLAATRNVEQRTGGPFGAAVFDSASGRLISVGVDLPLQQTSLLHAELNALAMAQHVLGTEHLGDAGTELHVSCEPCLMCIGAVIDARVPRLVCSMRGADLGAIGLRDTTPPESAWQELEKHNVEVVRNVLRDEGRSVLHTCRAARGRPATD